MMMNLQRNYSASHIAVRGFLLLVLWALAALALAGPVAGTVTHLSGPLMAKKAGGAIKILSVKSEVESGDTLVTEKNTYARVKFIDNSEITLKPDSTLTVENFSFDDGKPDADKASFNLVKGGLRSVSGLLGKRNREKFELKTPAATIGIRGTTFIVQYIPPPPLPPPGAAALLSTPVPLQTPTGSPLAKPGGEAGLKAPTMPAVQPGLHVSVLDGMIQVTNPGGSQAFNAGQFGYVPNMTAPPIVLPQNPGLQFTPPPVFNSSVPGSGSGSGATPPKSNAVDCEVR